MGIFNQKITMVVEIIDEFDDLRNELKERTNRDKSDNRNSIDTCLSCIL
jgi:hypothetical protein